VPIALKPTGHEVVADYDLVMMDLDGVVYISKRVIEGVPAVLDQLVARGVAHAYITNNASRTPEAVAEQLRSLGLPAEVSDVVTSAQAAARLLRTRFGDGAAVVCLGATGLREALAAETLVPVGVNDDGVALATGYGPDVLWKEIMRAAVRVREGLPWVASNTDGSIPTDFGVAPGHGVFVKMLSGFAEVAPEVAGKPEHPLFDETIRRVGGSRPLMVGDRLDTDILGANRAGLDSLLVLTGVSGLEDLVSASPELRPSYLSTTLSGLFAPHVVPSKMADAWVGGGWSARVDSGRLVVEANQGEAADPDVEFWWRVAVSAAWEWLDATGRPADIAGVRPPEERRVGAGK
jgi:HAD superfamily hydrolase (TIGR01450 family)